MDGDLKLYPLWPAATADMLLTVTYPSSPLPHYISVGQLSAFIAGGGITLPLAIAQGGTGTDTAAAALVALGGAPLASPAFTGTPSAPTQSPGDNSTLLATTAFVNTAVGFPAWDNISGKPATFPPTLPIAEAGVSGLVADLAAKAPLASPTFTGIPAAPTPVTADSTTRLATTAYVQAQTVALSGDVTASALLTASRTAIVTGLQGRPVASTGPTSNQVLQWSGSAWVPATLSTAAGAGGTAGQIQFNSAGTLAGFTMVGDATLNTATGALALATVNANTGTFQGLTVNAKGLVTGATTLASTVADEVVTTKTTNYTVQASDLGTTLVLSGVTFTLTLPAGIFTPGKTLGISVVASVSWSVTNSTGLTMVGLNASNLPGGSSGTFIANSDGATLNFIPGTQAATTSQVGGVQRIAAVANTFLTGITTLGVFQTAQPSFANLSGTATIAQGGTGQTTAAAALTALGGLSTTTATTTYLPLAGGTINGNTNLTLAPPSAWAVITFNKPAGNFGADIIAQRAGLTRWELTVADNTAEGGSNSGSNFVLSRFNDAGTFITSALTITRSSGDVTINGNTLVTAITNMQPPSGGDPLRLQTVAGQYCRIFQGVTGQHTYASGTSPTSQYIISDETIPASRLIIDSAGACSNLTGTWAAISDSTVKQDISPYTRGLQELLELSPVQFRYRPDTPFTTEYEPSPLRFGLIAEDVEPHIPEIVGETMGMVRGEEVPLKTLNNGDLVFALLNAVKELSERLVVLEDLLTGDGK